jgi:hypothetical protein
MNRLYVLVRRDLPGSQPFVQAAHAVAEWCINESSRRHWDGRDLGAKPWRWLNENLIMLGVENEAELMEWFELFRKHKPLIGATEGAVEFREPHYQNSMTAFAVVTDGSMLTGLELL